MWTPRTARQSEATSSRPRYFHGGTINTPPALPAKLTKTINFASLSRKKRAKKTRFFLRNGRWERTLVEEEQVPTKHLIRARRASELPIVAPMDVRRPIHDLHGVSLLVRLHPPRHRRACDVSFLACLFQLRCQASAPLRCRCAAVAQQRRSALLFVPLAVHQELWPSEVSLLW